jgi:hypothetical protein
MAVVSFAPSKVDLQCYAGDGMTIEVQVTDEDKNPLDVEGDVVAMIREKRTDSESLLSFRVDTTQASSGLITLSLTGDDTSSVLLYGQGRRQVDQFLGVYDVRWVPPASEPRTLMQGAFTCTLNVSR